MAQHKKYRGVGWAGSGSARGSGYRDPHSEGVNAGGMIAGNGFEVDWRFEGNPEDAGESIEDLGERLEAAQNGDELAAVIEENKYSKAVRDAERQRHDEETKRREELELVFDKSELGKIFEQARSAKQLDHMLSSSGFKND